MKKHKKNKIKKQGRLVDLSEFDLIFLTVGTLEWKVRRQCVAPSRPGTQEILGYFFLFKMVTNVPFKSVC